LVILFQRFRHGTAGHSWPAPFLPLTVLMPESPNNTSVARLLICGKRVSVFTAWQVALATSYREDFLQRLTLRHQRPRSRQENQWGSIPAVVTSFSR
jgi:hypothetical protein